MPRKFIFLGLLCAAVISLAFFSRQQSNTGRTLRPQAMQQLRDELTLPNPESFDQFDDSANTVSDPTPPDLDHPDNPAEPAIAGASNQVSDSTVKQTIKQEITDGSVKVKIDQKVDSNQPINNKVKVKIDTGQDPPLVEISLAPQPVICSSDAYDCDDFTTCTQAQAVYQSCSTDVHHFDPDNNGAPCDNLCL